MPLIETKCPECGASIKVNNEATGELRCPYCGSSYLAEKVININNVTNNITNNIYADNISIDTFDESKVLSRVRKLMLRTTNKKEFFKNLRDYSDIYYHNPDNEEAFLFTHLYADGNKNLINEVKLYNYASKKHDTELNNVIFHLAKNTDILKPANAISENSVKDIANLFGVKYVKGVLESSISKCYSENKYKDIIENYIKILNIVIPGYTYIPDSDTLKSYNRAKKQVKAESLTLFIVLVIVGLFFIALTITPMINYGEIFLSSETAVLLLFGFVCIGFAIYVLIDYIKKKKLSLEELNLSEKNEKSNK